MVHCSGGALVHTDASLAAFFHPNGVDTALAETIGDRKACLHIHTGKTKTIGVIVSSLFTNGTSAILHQHSSTPRGS